MAWPTWPTTLPDIKGQADGTSISSFAWGAVETQMDDGPPRRRRRTTSNITTITVALMLPNFTMLNAFKTFIQTDLAGGTRQFRAPIFLTTGLVATRTCQFQGDVGASYPTPTSASLRFTLLVWDY